MSSTAAVAGDPWAVAEAAMRRAGVRVRPLETLDEITAACRLLHDVWGIGPGEPSEVQPSLLRALGYGGNYVVGAYRADEPAGAASGRMVGASVAFFTAPLGAGMHSHITGVLPGDAGRGVGAAVKWHQRAWSLDRGVGRIRWTFDPLIARNSFFNLTRLGARPERYFVDFYGPMDDGPNRGQPTDRLDVAWDLLSASTCRSADAVLRPAAATGGPDVDIMRAAGAVAVLSVGPDGAPVAAERGGAERVLIQIPSDIEAIRHTDPGPALRWRLALRAVLAPLLTDESWRVTGFARSGWYVVERFRMAGGSR